MTRNALLQTSRSLAVSAIVFLLMSATLAFQRPHLVFIKRFATMKFINKHADIAKKNAVPTNNNAVVNNNNISNESTLRKVVSNVVKKNGNTKKSDDSWLRWMNGGKPRGTNKVILREAEALGGVPRSDRYASRDWWHSAITLPNSGVLRDIRSPVLAITSWATFLSILHRKLQSVNPAAAQSMYLSSTPYSLLMSALSLLLVFRTNSAYQRFAEGRAIWERIVNTSRDIFRMVMLYEKQIGIEKRRRVQRLVAAFPYLLRHRIRPNLVMRRVDDEQYQRDPENTILLYQDISHTDNDPEWAALASAEEETGKSRRKTRPLYYVDKRTLPWRLLPPDALEACARAQNRPLWVCDRLAYEFRNVPINKDPDFTNRERMTLISQVDKLSQCIGGSERIHQTVVPLNYARHTLRALTIFLVSLPFCLLKDLKLLTGPVLFLASWMLFGVFEIGYAIEDPFQGTLRLSILCDTIRRDVLGDERIRTTAFLGEDVDNDDDLNNSSNIIPKDNDTVNENPATTTNLFPTNGGIATVNGSEEPASTTNLFPTNGVYALATDALATDALATTANNSTDYQAAANTNLFPTQQIQAAADKASKESNSSSDQAFQ